jgi:hypothetical protein
LEEARRPATDPNKKGPASWRHRALLCQRRLGQASQAQWVHGVTPCEPAFLRGISQRGITRTFAFLERSWPQKGHGRSPLLRKVTRPRSYPLPVYFLDAGRPQRVRKDSHLLSAPTNQPRSASPRFLSQRTGR